MINKVLGFIKTNKKNILLVLMGIAIVLLISIPTCNKNNPYVNQQETIDSLILANQYKSVIINQKEEEVNIQTAIVVSNQKLINKLSDSVFALKKKNSKNTNTIAYVSEYTEAELEDYLLGFVDTTAFKEFSDSVSKQCEDVISYMKENTITVPRPIKDSTADFYLTGNVTQQGVMIDSLSIPDSAYIRFVEHKGGLLKRNSLGKVKLWTKKSIEAQILHTNKHIKVNKINSIFFVPKIKQRWLEKALVTGAASLITYKLLK